MFSAGVASEQVTESGGRHHLEHVVRPGQRIAAVLAERFDKGEQRHRDKAPDGYPQRRGILKELTLLIQYIIKTGDMPSSWTSYEEDGSRLIETKDLIEELLEDDETK